MHKYDYRGMCRYCDWTSGLAGQFTASKLAGEHAKSEHPDKRPNGVPIQRIERHAHYEAGKIVGSLE